MKVAPAKYFLGRLFTNVILKFNATSFVHHFFSLSPPLSVRLLRRLLQPRPGHGPQVRLQGPLHPRAGPRLLGRGLPRRHRLRLPLPRPQERRDQERRRHRGRWQDQGELMEDKKISVFDAQTTYVVVDGGD